MSGTGAIQLGEVASFVRGITFKPDDVVPVGSPGSVACMRTKNVQRALDLSDVWGIPPSLVKREDQYLEPGDILVSSANSWNLVGKCCWVPQLPWQATFGGFISVLRGDSSRIEPRYLYHWFSSPRVQATVRSFGQQTTNISNLNIGRCERLAVPVPTLHEQRRIAEILDKADALRAMRRAALAKLDTVTQSIFLDVFGDPAMNPMGFEKRRVGDVVSRITNGFVGPTRDIYQQAGVPYLLARHVKANKLTFDGKTFISEAFNRKNKKSILKTDDVLLVQSGHTGESAVVPPEHEGHNCHAMIVLTPRHDLLTGHFLSRAFETAAMQRAFKGIQTGITLAHLNCRDVRELLIPIPPLALQRDFSRCAISMDKLKAAHRYSLAAMDALFDSLQQRSFSGELLA